LKVVESFDIEPQEEEILRLLSRGRSPAEAGNWTLDLVKLALGEASELAEPRGVYDVVGRAQIPDHRVFESAERIGFCVCTIGPELETRVSDLMKQGELAVGVVLDAVGSELAEAAARWIDSKMEEDYAGEDLLPSARFSPGYGDWDLQGQRLIFDLMDTRRIGVELSASMMMKPRKSVSFAINFGPDPNPPRCTTPCDLCDLEDCPFKR